MVRQLASTKPALIEDSIDLVRYPRQEGTTSAKERKFDCGWDGCLKSFNREYDLNRHIMGHTGEKPFRCLRGCGEAFAQGSRMKEHVEWVHDRNETKPCSVCLELFGSSKALNTHMKVMHGNMQECIECGLSRCISIKCTRRAHCHDPTHPVPSPTAKASSSKARKERQYNPYSTKGRGNSRSATPASIILAAANTGSAALQTTQRVGMMALPVLPLVPDVYDTISSPPETVPDRFLSPASPSPSATSYATGPSSSTISSSTSSYSSSLSSSYNSLSPTSSSTSDVSFNSPWTHSFSLNALEGTHHTGTERRRTAPPKDKSCRHKPYSTKGRSKIRRSHANDFFSTASSSSSTASYDIAPSSSATSSSSSTSPASGSFLSWSSASELSSPKSPCSPLSPLTSQIWHNIEQTGLDLPMPFASPSSPASSSPLSFAEHPPASPSSSSSSFGSSTSATSWPTASEPSPLQSPGRLPSSDCASPDQLSTAVQKMLAEALDAGLTLDPAPAPHEDCSYIADTPYAITHPAYFGFCMPKLPEDVHWSLAHTAVAMDLGAIGRLDLQVLLGSSAEASLDLEDLGLGLKVSENIEYWDALWGEHEHMDMDVDKRMPGSWH